MCFPVKNHDLVSSLPDNSKSQAHSMMPECDGRLSKSRFSKCVSSSSALTTIVARQDAVSDMGPEVLSGSN